MFYCYVQTWLSIFISTASCFIASFLALTCYLSLQDILEQAQHLSRKALVTDYIPTVYLRGVTGSTGGDVQVWNS